MAIRKVSNDKIRWVHIDVLDDAAHDYIKGNFKFHQLDLEDVKSETHHPKIDIYKEYIFLVFHVPKFDAETRKFSTEEINMFIGKDYVVTIQKKPSDTITFFFERLTHNSRLKKDMILKGTGFLSYKILSHAFRNIYPTAGLLGKDLIELEEAVFEEGGGRKKLVRLLALTRRNILGMRRILDPQRSIIGSLMQARKSFLPEALSPYFDDIRDHINKAQVLLDGYKDSIDGLNETNESILSFRTNEIIKILTIISVALLPANLLTGFYGMNVIGLPYAEHPMAVFGLFSVLIAIIVTILWFVRKKKWY